jgi:hypothetical protein
MAATGKRGQTTRSLSEVVAVRWKFWRQNPEPPPCGGEPPQSGEPSPQRGASCIERASAALGALEHVWAGAADSPHSDDWSPRRLAIEFRSQLQAHPDLVGMWIGSDWVRGVYPMFSRAQGVACPPAHRLFAEELARLLPRRRKDIRQGGKRTCTITMYGVRDPETAVVELAGARRSA